MASELAASHDQPRKPRRRRVLWWGLGILLLLLIAGYLAVGAIAANLLTSPQRDFDPANNPGVYGATYEDVRFPARGDGVEIAGWYLPADGAQQAVILVHGRDASRSAAITGHFPELATALQKAGFAVLMLDLRGYGESGAGRFTFGLKERQDVLGAVDWLTGQGFAPGSIGALGISLGAAATIGAAAAEPAIGAVATDSAFADINTLITEQWETASGLPRPFLYSALFVARLLTGVDITAARPVAELPLIANRPLLLIHCVADDYIPSANLESLHEAAPAAQTWPITGSNCKHAEGYNVDPTAYAQRVAEFFDANLP